MVGECTQDLSLVAALNVPSVAVCNVVLIGTWLPLFGHSCCSCTTLKLHTVSCPEIIAPCCGIMS